MGRDGRGRDTVAVAMLVAALAFWVHVLAARAGLAVSRAAAVLQGALWAVVLALLVWSWWRAHRWR